MKMNCNTLSRDNVNNFARVESESHCGRAYLVNMFTRMKAKLRLRPLRLPAISLLGLLLGACANIANYTEPAREPAQVEERSVDGQVLPYPGQSSIQAEELPSQVQVSPVVQGLLVSAEQQSSHGNPSAAANSLERALRIEPRNALLWSRLADIRFGQSNWQQAIQLAAKSNTLAGNDRQLRRRNWYLMANSYSALDNPAQVQKYRDKLRNY
jgi:tetratricopeptide (TPR) repeat protein